MDDQPDPNPEFAHSTTFNPGSPSGDSGMFSGSQHFTVTAQTLTNITNYTTAPSVPSNFRMIPLGDIDLRREIQTTVANYSPERVRVRRIYSAKVEGRESSVTVAMYQGHDAEKEWREDIAKYMSARHPNIVQIAGAASSGEIHATLFHDELIPIDEFVQPYQHSHFLQVHVYACCTRDFTAGYCFLSSAFHPNPGECMSWVRCSTGRLCLDPTQPGEFYPLPFEAHDSPDIYALSSSTVESIKIIIDSLSIGLYHNICFSHLARYVGIFIPASATVKLETVFCLSPSHLLEDSIEIGSLSNAAGACLPPNWWNSRQAVGEVMKDGWTRFQSGILPDSFFQQSWLDVNGADCWLSQANHIFRHLQITSNFEDYVYLYSIHFFLTFPKTTEDIPAGFLFLCPEEDFKTGPLSFRWPDCPAYWSLDPSGVNHLSLAEATQLGFPPFQLTTTIFGKSWDASVYDGLRQFHQAKHFDPYSQDVAQHLGLPLFELSSKVDPPFAHVDDEDFDSESDCDTLYTADEGSAVEDVVDDVELSYFEEDHLDLTTINGEDLSEPAEILTGQDHTSESTFGQHAVELPTIHQEMPAPLLIFKLLMNTQLVLILFLALTWLHNYFDSGK